MDPPTAAFIGWRAVLVGPCGTKWRLSRRAATSQASWRACFNRSRRCGEQCWRSCFKVQYVAASYTGHFLHGVASGDPYSNSVVLWTRITPALPYGEELSASASIAVQWHVTRADTGLVVQRAEWQHSNRRQSRLDRKAHRRWAGALNALHVWVLAGCWSCVANRRYTTPADLLRPQVPRTAYIFYPFSLTRTVHWTFAVWLGSSCALRRKPYTKILEILGNFYGSF